MAVMRCRRLAADPGVVPWGSTGRAWAYLYS